MSSNSQQPELQNESDAGPDPKQPDFGNVQPPDADKFEETAAVEVQPANAAPSKEGAERDDPKLRKAEENLDSTMREFLNVLKHDDDAGEVDAPLDSELNSEEQIEKNNAAVLELINSVTGLDEEGRSRQRILTFAARRYASALERNPEDYDAFYNWALVLQESADNISPESRSPSKDDLLKEACRMYDEATCLCPTLNDAYYNWAIAISDRAKIRRRTKEAEELWKQATKKYEKAVQLNWNSPQALNNWGLALQELSTIVPAREKQTIVKTAISKFRAAIRLQFDFHRAIYNLGTVLYGLAEDISRTKGNMNSKDVSPDELYSQSAIYIAAAHSLKPNYSVYTDALMLVRSMLPLPYLKVGYLTAPPLGNLIAPHSVWQRSQFILNHEALQQVDNINQVSSTSGDSPTTKPVIRVNIPDIVSVSASSDLTLPPGAGLCIDTIQGTVLLLIARDAILISQTTRSVTSGVEIAESWEYLEGWLDAIRLVYTIFTRGKSDVLASIITT